MKKIISLLMVLLLGSLMVSCSSSKNDSPSAGMPNPIIEYKTIDDINKKAGTYLVIPSSFAVTDVRYSTINDEISQIDFKMDDHEWTVRGSKTVDQDISGIHNEDNIFTPGSDFGAYLPEFFLDRFFTEGIQYTFVLSGADGYDTAKFSEYAMEISDAIKKASDPKGIAGNYQDLTSQRASMEILKLDDIYDITVRWASSATEETQWYMSGTLDGNKITYGGENITVYEYDENGSETCTDATATNNLGYFEIKDNKLYWTGAAQDQCKECIFEKIGY